MTFSSISLNVSEAFHCVNEAYLKLIWKSLEFGVIYSLPWCLRFPFNVGGHIPAADGGFLGCQPQGPGWERGGLLGCLKRADVTLKAGIQLTLSPSRAYLFRPGLFQQPFPGPPALGSPSPLPPLASYCLWNSVPAPYSTSRILQEIIFLWLEFTFLKCAPVLRFPWEYPSEHRN